MNPLWLILTALGIFSLGFLAGGGAAYGEIAALRRRNKELWERLQK